MDKEQRHTTYRKFETVRVNGAAHAITAPIRAIQHTAQPTSVQTGKLQELQEQTKGDTERNSLRGIFPE